MTDNVIKSASQRKTKNYAIIVAGGSGTRLGSAHPKQYLELGGKPVLTHAFEVFYNSSLISGVIVVVPDSYLSYCDTLIISYPLTKPRKVVTGGSERHFSVYNGIVALPNDTDIVLIHDSVRPFVTEQNIVDVIEKTLETDAAILAIPVKDTIKSVNKNKMTITSTPERSTLYAAQTPQGFRYELIKKAYEQAIADNFHGYDDASFVERIGVSPSIVLGSDKNFKITTLYDLELARMLINQQP